MPMQLVRTGWRYLAAACVVGVINFLTPDSTYLLPLLVVPIVASAMRANEQLVVLVGIVTAVFAGHDLAWHHHPLAQVWPQILVVVAVAAVATWLAHRQRTTTSEIATLGETVRQYAENTTDILFFGSPERTIQWVSPSISNVLGWSPEEVVGTNTGLLLHPDDRVLTERLRARAYAGSSPGTDQGRFVARLRTRDHGYKWMSVHLGAVRTAVGEFTGVVGSVADVDELFRARADAALQRDSLRQAIDATLDPLVILESVLDSSGAITDLSVVDLNPAMLRFVGCGREQAIGRAVRDVCGPDFARSGLLDLCLESLRHGDPIMESALPYGSGGSARFLQIRGARITDARLVVTWRDVSVEHREGTRLAISERMYRGLAENVSDVVLRADAENRILWISPSCSSTLGVDPDEVVGLPATEFIHSADLESLLDVARHGVATRDRIRVQFRWMRRSGVPVWVEATGRFLEDDGSGNSGWIVLLRDIETQVATERELRWRATVDELTGALKRSEAMHRLTAIGRGSRKLGDETALLFIDLDDFKTLNDTWGHQAGDAILGTMADRARAVLREGDSIARMGGDEFLIWLEHCHDLDSAAEVAEKLRLAFREPVDAGSTELRCTVSIGVTLWNPGEDVDSFIARADMAMYAAKSHGRDQVWKSEPPKLGADSAVVRTP